MKDLNFIAIGRREFISNTTSAWKSAADEQKVAELAGLEGMPPPNVIEATFNKPQPGQPTEVKWVLLGRYSLPGLGKGRLIIQLVGRQTDPRLMANERHGKPLNHHVPDKAEADHTGPDIGEAASPSGGGGA